MTLLFGPKLRTQLELPLERQKAPDRNFHKGGRSFYFFDLDDNVLHVGTHVFVFHKEHKTEHPLSTRDYVLHQNSIGSHGPYRDYEMRFSDSESYRRFRDWPDENPFIEDLIAMLWRPETEWQGPSWDFFYHAVFNHRPIALITARGHHPETIRKGFELLVNTGILPHSPNFLDIFPVSHADTRKRLADDDLKASIAELKKRAILLSVERAMNLYGENPFHRFGMSDDDPNNLKLIEEAFRELKTQFVSNKFFVFSASERPVVRREIGHDDTTHEITCIEDAQMNLFGKSG